MSTATVHQMKCDEPWFSMIRDGRKPLTGRLFTPKYQALKPGDEVELICGEETFRTKVAALKKFDSIREYLHECTLAAALPGVEMIEEGVKIYSSFPGYTKENEEIWGFIAIYFKKS